MRRTCSSEEEQERGCFGDFCIEIKVFPKLQWKVHCISQIATDSLHTNRVISLRRARNVFPQEAERHDFHGEVQVQENVRAMLRDSRILASSGRDGDFTQHSFCLFLHICTDKVNNSPGGVAENLEVLRAVSVRNV